MSPSCRDLCNATGPGNWEQILHLKIFKLTEYNHIGQVTFAVRGTTLVFWLKGLECGHLVQGDIIQLVMQGRMITLSKLLRNLQAILPPYILANKLWRLHTRLIDIWYICLFNLIMAVLAVSQRGLDFQSPKD
jgi:hypothetical protein